MSEAIQVKVPATTPLSVLAEAANALGCDFVMEGDQLYSFTPRTDPPEPTLSRRSGAPDQHIDDLLNVALLICGNPHYIRNLITCKLLSDDWRPLAAAFQRLMSTHLQGGNMASAGTALAELLDQLAAHVVTAQTHDEALPKWLQVQAW